MEKFIIRGGNKLNGSVEIGGAKNAVVAILPAALMASDICILENVPDIADVHAFEKILRDLGCKIKREGKSLIIDPRNIVSTVASSEEVRSMRGSYYLIGALLGRFHEAAVDNQGGCKIGERPIDQHLKGFEKLGVNIQVKNNAIHAKVSKLKGAHIYFDVVTVGATINVMLAAALAEGQTVLENAAREPHVVDVANFLNMMGANIKGAGTDVIKINGVNELKGGTYSVIPDQIEASTYMIAAAACGGEVEIKNVIPKHLESVTAKLEEMGAQVTEFDDSVIIKSSGRLKAVNVKTLPYPGFPTDVQQPMAALMTIADGESIINESIYETRFNNLIEFNKMGANCSFKERIATIKGVEKLKGTDVIATDLRAGASLLIAGLMAEGTTTISEIQHIDRGYPHIEEKLKGIGAVIERVIE